jgi:glycosyltransferase involved in cell wall biosynthesis
MVSVIIPTLGRPEMARQAASSALAQKMPKGWSSELLVIDDGGKDATQAALKGLKGLRYLWKEHAGPAAARNFGARAAKGSLLAFLDSDTLALPGWLSAGAARLSREGGLFGVEGKAVAQSPYRPGPFVEAVENPSGGRWLTCNLFVRKKDFLELGGFDERFKRPVREDSEFAFRAMESGKRFAFEPRAVVSHPVRQVGPGRFFFHAREGIYEALIERQHPASYRRHFKWLDGRALPAYYYAHYLALPLAWLCPRLGAALLGLGVLALLYAWCRKRRVALLDPLRLLIPALLVPYLRLAWVAWGYLCFPRSPE